MQKREKATDHVTGNGAVQVCGTREKGDAVYTLTLERAGLVELHRGASICQYTTAMFLCYDLPDPRPTGDAPFYFALELKAATRVPKHCRNFTRGACSLYSPV